LKQTIPTCDAALFSYACTKPQGSVKLKINPAQLSICNLIK
jgi:hypothetical protein